MSTRNRRHVGRPHRGLGILLAATLALAGCQAGADPPRARPVEGLDVRGADRLYEDRYEFPAGLYLHPVRGLVIGSIPEGEPVKLASATRPGETGTLAAGQIITHLNGVKPTSLDELYRALDQSNGEFELRVLDPQKDRTDVWRGVAKKHRIPIVGRPGDPKPERVVRGLLIGDTKDARLGDAITDSLKGLEQDIKGLIPTEFVKIEAVTGDDCTAEKIIDRVNRLEANPDDAIVCYYLGHGAYDPGLGSGIPPAGTSSSFPGGDLPRRTLFDHLLARPGRLKVLFSDSCNVSDAARVPVRLVMEMTVERRTKPTPFEQLVRYHRGVIDVNSSSVGQYSWYNRNIGGWFTYTLQGRMNGSAEWPKFLADVSDASNSFFKQRRAKFVDSLTAGAPLDSDGKRLKDQTAMIPSVYRLTLMADTKVEDRTPFDVRRRVRVLIDEPKPK